MIAFFVIAFLILALGYGYVGWRLIPALHLQFPWQWIAWGCLVLLLSIPPTAMMLSVRRVENGWADTLAGLGYVSLGFFSLLITIVFARDVVWLVSLGVQKLIALSGGSLAPLNESILPSNLERRRFLVRGMSVGIASVAAALTAYGYYEAKRRPAIVHVVVPLPNLPPEFDGFRIVQITDIHAGLTVKRDFIDDVVQLVKSLNADLIAFTGDLVDGSVSHLREHVAPLGELSAPFGKFFITGNHEYYSGAEAWVEEAKRLGFDVLLNEHRIIERGADKILIAGVTDYSGGQFIKSHASNPKAAIANAPVCDANILLAHQPKSVREASRAGFDLQISGHTHGGQFFPWNLAASLDQPFIAGLHRFENMWIYVSKGTGYWGPPVRLGARSEVTVITLRKGRATA